MKKSGLIPALGIVITLQITPALAGQQIYPGSMCVRWSGSDVVPTLGGSIAYNPSSTREMRVDCPILHQNFNPAFGNNLDDARIGIIDQHPTRNARCWLNARYIPNNSNIFFGSSGGIGTTINGPP